MKQFKYKFSINWRTNVQQTDEEVVIWNETVKSKIVIDVYMLLKRIVKKSLRGILVIFKLSTEVLDSL